MDMKTLVALMCLGSVESKLTIAHDWLYLIQIVHGYSKRIAGEETPCNAGFSGTLRQIGANVKRRTVNLSLFESNKA